MRVRAFPSPIPLREPHFNIGCSTTTYAATRVFWLIYTRAVFNRVPGDEGAGVEEEEEKD